MTEARLLIGRLYRLAIFNIGILKWLLYILQIDMASAWEMRILIIACLLLLNQFKRICFLGF